jgi:hypothetical protein
MDEFSEEYNGLDDPRRERAPLRPPPLRRRGPIPWWVWLITAIAILFAAGIGFLAYIGIRGPDTKIYAGNEVPRRFLSTLREMGALEAGESVRFFYSSAILDFRGSFCFVSDRKVAVYDSEAERSEIRIAFDEIEDAELVSGSSWIVDGAITLTLKDGDVVSFEVSSEMERDKKFLKAIEEGMDRARKAARKDPVEENPAPEDAEEPR